MAADDKDLNAWVSVKKMSQYRTPDDEAYEVRKYRKRASKKVAVAATSVLGWMLTTAFAGQEAAGTAILSTAR